MRFSPNWLLLSLLMLHVILALFQSPQNDPQEASRTAKMTLQVAKMTPGDLPDPQNDAPRGQNDPLKEAFLRKQVSTQVSKQIHTQVSKQLLQKVSFTKPLHLRRSPWPV